MQVSEDNSSNKFINNINVLIETNSNIESDYIDSLKNDDVQLNNKDSNNVEKMIYDKNILQSQIYNFYNLIKNNEKDIEDLDRYIYKLCNHNWVNDDSACFDDRCKHICSKCNLYQSSYMYR